MSRIAPSRIRTPRGFTLLEMIVVVVILAILAAAAVPRLVGNERRQFQLAVDQVADLLTMYAQRESTGMTSVGLEKNSANRLGLVILDIDPSRPGQPAMWRPDHNVKPVALPKFMREDDVVVFADGDEVDIAQWPLTNSVGQDRPAIDVVMYGPGETATLTLPPYGTSPVRMHDLRDSAGVRERVDLDGTGRSREDW